jgi:hypothetical protein
VAAAPAPQPIKAKWGVMLGGFFQADSIWDSTQSFNDAAVGGPVARPGSYAADHNRLNFSIRNSRLGLKFTAPEVGGVRSSGFVEVDFLGNQVNGTPPLTETQNFSNPSMRARHVYVKLENDYVNLLVGQAWHVFGWQPAYFPNTTALQGVPGQLFTRSMQVQLEHMIKGDAVSVDVAVAAVRPPQRDSGLPDGQGGLRLLVSKLKTYHVNGNGGALVLDPASLAVSGLARRFRVKDLMNQAIDQKVTGWGVSVDALAPIIPASEDHHGNTLMVQGSFQTGAGFNDQYLGFTGGVVFPAPANPAMTMPAPTYTPNVDPGIVTFNQGTGRLLPVKWTLFLVGLQYYLPPNGNFWIATNFSRTTMSDVASYGFTIPGALTAAQQAGLYTKAMWFDANLMWQVLPAVRFGVEYSQYRQTYLDGVEAKTHRGQFTGWFLF